MHCQLLTGVQDLEGLCDAIKDAHTKWFEIGMELKLDQRTLQPLRDNPGSSSIRLKKMLRLWLTRDPLPTIPALSNALRQPMIRYPVAASNVDRYMNGKAQNLRLPLAAPSLPGKRVSKYRVYLKILNCMREKRLGLR